MTEQYVLRLYVTGMTARSSRAVNNLRTICDEYLEGRYDLEVIDIYQQPALTRGEQIVAAPTLIKKLPLPMRRIIGGHVETATACCSDSTLVASSRQD
jgi:circadian clock protein KaiB